MKTFKQFLDLLSEAPLPPEVERSIAASVNKGYPYRTPEYQNSNLNIRLATRRETGYKLPKYTPSGMARVVVSDKNPLQIHIYGHENDQSPTVHKMPTVTKIAAGSFMNERDKSYKIAKNSTAMKQNLDEFGYRNEHSVLIPHSNGKEHHYINNFEHGVLAPSFYVGSGGSYLVAGKVKRLNLEDAKANKQMQMWTKTKSHPGVNLREYDIAMRGNNRLNHENEIVRQHQDFIMEHPHLRNDLHEGNLGGYTDPVSGKTKLVILDAGGWQ